MSRAQVLLAALLAALPLAGCDNIDAPIDPISGAPSLYPEGMDGAIKEAGFALEQADGCRDLDAELRAVLITEMISSVQASFAQALISHELCKPWWTRNGVLASQDVAPPQDAPQSPAHSETNNQVPGVDEPDLIKTDGNYLYQVGNGALRIVRSWPAASTALAAKVAIEGTPKKLFVQGDRVLVYSSLGDPSISPYYGWWFNPDGECTYGYQCVPTGDGLPTKITIFDVSDRTAPRLMRELKLSSSFLAARRIGNTVHTVVTYGLRRPTYEVYPTDLEVCDASRTEIYDRFRALLLANLSQLRSVEIGALPTVEDRVYGAAGATTKAPLVDCRGFLRSSLADGAQITSLITLGLDDESAPHTVNIISRPGFVYGSPTALYLAEPRVHGYYGWFMGFGNTAEATTVHKFDLQGDAPAYVASGIIRGRVISQFALDEQDGFLRLASTVGAGRDGLHNLLTVLEPKGNLLVEAGLIDGIAPGEDIRSVRFDGDRGYVVTFKKTDPLFVLDLADPHQPRLLGELKIPGFSTYMHRLDANHLLTIGYDGNDLGSFAWFTNVLLQIFDVSSPTAPRLTFKHAIGTRGSSSEALANHLAFTYYAPKNLLALPMTICDGGSEYGMYGSEMSFSGLMLFDVTAQSGFGLRGEVPFPAESVSCSNWWTQGSSAVKRSVIIDNYVFSVSDTLLKVNDLGAPQIDLVTLALD